MAAHLMPILTGLLFTLAAAAFATALVLGRRRGIRDPTKATLLAAAYGGLGVAALIAMWRLWGPGVGAVSAGQFGTIQRSIAVFALLIVALLVAALAGLHGTRRPGRRRSRDHDDIEEMKHLTVAAAHDLKTPLRSIHASATLLERRLEPRGVEKDAIDHIKDSARRLTTMVDELLGYTKVANAAPQMQELRFLRVAQAVEGDLDEVIDSRNASVEWRGGGSLFGDPGLLERALRNLVENAIKYGPSGGHVVVKAEPFFGGLRITVEDEGPGVPEDERERIFEVFQRGSTGLGQPGSGIGLATVAKVAQLHSGTVGVESGPGMGSRFWLWIPGPHDPQRKAVQSAEPIVGPMPVVG